MTSQESVCDNVDNNSNENVIRQQETQRDVSYTAPAAASVNDNAPMDDQNELTLKIVFVGACSTGAKTCLVQRIVNDTFEETTRPTVGAAFMTKKINVDGTPYRMELWGLSFLLLPFLHVCLCHAFCLTLLQQILLARKVL